MKKTYFIRGLIVLAIFLFLVGLKVLYTQREHFIKGEKYYADSQWKPAMREYDEAMHFYTPWSPYIEKSAKRLWSMGEMFEKEGKPDWAFDAISAIRSSFYASRGLYTPGKKWIEKCDEKLADLDVKMLTKDGSVKPENAASEKAKLLYVMKVNRAPAPMWAAFVEASFFGWIASIIFIIFRGFDEKGRMKVKFALYGFLFFTASFVFWLISLIKA